MFSSLAQNFNQLMNGHSQQRDLQLANNESNMVVKPGEIHMNDDELRDGIEPSSLTEHEEGNIRESHRTGMDERE